MGGLARTASPKFSIPCVCAPCVEQPPEPCCDVNVVCDHNRGTAEQSHPEDHQEIFQCQHVLSPFSLLPAILRRTNRVFFQALRRKLYLQLPLQLKRARNHSRAVRDGQARRAAIRRSRLHQSQREVKKRGLQGQRGKKREHRDDDYSSESKHCFHLFSPEVRWAGQLFADTNGRWGATR
jgi:hypothetical protein